MATTDSLLLESITELQVFLALIQAERQSLSGGDVNQLQDIAEKKSASAMRLAGLEAQRDALLESQGFGDGRKGVDAWLASLAAKHRRVAADAWKTYRNRVAEAKRENELNGKLIAAGLKQNQQALEVLLGDPADASTYGADGQRTAASGRRTLGSA